MKKILLALTLVGLSITGVIIANAQYYDYGSSMYDYGTSYDTSYSSMGYTNISYSYPQTNYYYPGGSYNYGGYYGGGYGYYGTGGIGSYTVGCTTYFYNTRTGAQLYTRYICNIYQYQHPTCYYTCTNPYTYPYYGNYYGGTQYCTYRYVNGAWYPSCGY